jgi:hypothetical protein
MLVMTALVCIQYFQSSNSISSIMSDNAVRQDEAMEEGAVVVGSKEGGEGEQHVYFRTYGTDDYAWTKRRIVQEALDTGWFVR